MPPKFKRAQTAKRTFHVAGLGEGVRVRKAVDLSIRHSNAEVSAVELEKTKHARYLKERLKALGKRLEKPANLAVLEGTDALHFLESKKPNSLHHLYAHLLLEHFPHSKRMAVFRQAIRVLKPNGRFLLIDTCVFTVQLKKELESAGFQVFSKPLGIKQIKQLETDRFDFHAKNLSNLKSLEEHFRGQTQGFADYLDKLDRIEFRRREDRVMNRPAVIALRDILAESKKSHRNVPKILAEPYFALVAVKRLRKM